MVENSENGQDFSNIPITQRPDWANELGVIGPLGHRVLKRNQGGLVQLFLKDPSLSLKAITEKLYGEVKKEQLETYSGWSENLIGFTNAAIAKKTGLAITEITQNAKEVGRRRFSLLPVKQEEPRKEDPKRVEVKQDRDLQEATRKQAIINIEHFLSSHEAQHLRDYQIDFIENMLEGYKAGNTAGYISAATGSGKSEAIAALIKAHNLHLQNKADDEEKQRGVVIILNPTRQILEQNAQKIAQRDPNLALGNYYTDEKDVEGCSVINTTYHSLPILIQSGLVKSEDIRLLISDEVHKGLGEQRHSYYRYAPNALMVGLTATPYFRPLESYQRRGLIDPHEGWTGLFLNNLAELGLEEAMERGILANLDIHLLRTGCQVDNIQISQFHKDYNAEQLDKLLNTYSRNVLTLGMVAGVDSMPSGVSIPDDQKEQITQIHAQIKGKKTAIFGLSIDHIEQLATDLEKLGIKVGTIHSKKDSKERRAVLEKYKAGEIQVVLGVDALRLGWDSPETEVGIYMAPTRSGIVAVQELGRILRKSEETGKEKAIAIQLVDRFVKPFQAPITIPNLFDPYFLLRGTTSGEEMTPRSLWKKTNKPLINLFGVSIDTLFESGSSTLLLHERIKKGDLNDINESLDSLIQQIYSEDSDISPIKFYQRLAEHLPYFIPQETQVKLLQAIASIDTNTVNMGKNLLVMTHMRSILTAAGSYFTDDEEFNSDLIQESLSLIFSNLKNLNSEYHLSLQLNNLVNRACANFIAKKDYLPANWVIKGIQNQILEEIDQFSGTLIGLEAEAFAEKLAEKYSVTPSSIYDYLSAKITPEALDQPDFEDTTFRAVAERIDSETLWEVVDSLPVLKHREILRGRYRKYPFMLATLQEVADEIELSRGRIGQLEGAALMKLRHPERRRKISPYLDDDYATHPLRYMADRRFYYKDFEEIFQQKIRQLYPIRVNNVFGIREEHFDVPAGRLLRFVDPGLELSIPLTIETFGDLTRLRHNHLDTETYNQIVRAYKTFIMP